MKIDLHAHFVPDVSYETGGREGAKHSSAIGKDASGKAILTIGDLPRSVRKTSDPVEYIRYMDKIRLDMRAISVLPPYIYYDVGPDDGLVIARRQNDAIAQVQTAYPDRFIGMATVPMQDVGKAVAELDRAVTQLRLKAVEIAAAVNGKNLDEKEFWPFYQKVQELDIPIFVHPVAPRAAGVDRMRKYFLDNLIGNPLETTIAAASIIFGGVLEQFPRLKFVFAHSGGFTPFIQGRWEHGYEEVEECRTIPKPPSEYLKMMYFDCLNHYGPALSFMVNSVGANRVVIGTDYPAEMGLFDPVSHVRNAPEISEKDKETILEKTALTLLKM